MSASVDIYTKELKDVITVPIQAVTAREVKDSDNGELEEIVFVYEADTLRKVVVETGIQDNKNIFVKSGIETGETVVTGPYSILSKELINGQTVEVIDKGEDKKEK